MGGIKHKNHTPNRPKLEQERVKDYQPDLCCPLQGSPLANSAAWPDLCLHFSLNLYQFLINEINLTLEKALTFRQVLPSVTQWVRWGDGSISLFIARKPRIEWVLVKAQCLRQRHQGLVNGLYGHRNWEGVKWAWDTAESGPVVRVCVTDKTGIWAGTPTKERERNQKLLK